ncbi:MAG TPA: ammonia channel protein, partial [Elusimicrobiota bacterium]|nr:ammonia channel protein [Elusimicrobiota bacterium]
MRKPLLWITLLFAAAAPLLAHAASNLTGLSENQTREVAAMVDRAVSDKIAAAKPAVDTGDTAWILVSAALVLMMTPALAFFYGGLVRRKNML